jgi:hypothetical protein
MIKNHRLYPLYVSYLEYKKELDKVSEGALSLLKMSESSFNDFVYDYEKSPKFYKLINDLYKKESRDEKINDLLNGTNRRNHNQ